MQSYCSEPFIASIGQHTSTAFHVKFINAYRDTYAKCKFISNMMLSSNKTIENALYIHTIKLNIA